MHKLYIFDADETLRTAVNTHRPYPINNNQWILADNVTTILSKYEWKNTTSDGLYYGIVSNQPGISRGEITNEEAFKLLVRMFESAFNFKPLKHLIKFCPHQHIEGCDCRKPQAKLFKEIAEYWNVKPYESIFIGDRKSDKEAAKNFGCHFEYSKDFFLTSSDNNG